MLSKLEPSFKLLALVEFFALSFASGILGFFLRLRDFYLVFDHFVNFRTFNIDFVLFVFSLLRCNYSHLHHV